MKFLKYNSNNLVNVNISKYLVKWDRKVSVPQLTVKKFFYPYWKNSIILEEFMIPGSLFRLDLLNLNSKVCVEVSPIKLHLHYNKFMHGGRAGFLKKLQDDAKKMDWCERAGFKFIELYDIDIENLSKQYLKEKFDLDL